MDNQHRKISGYRELTQADIDLMNEVKSLGPQIEAVMKKVEAHIQQQYRLAIGDREVGEPDDFASLDKAKPAEWLLRAEERLQLGLMCLTRAVAQPTFF